MTRKEFIEKLDNLARDCNAKALNETDTTKQTAYLSRAIAYLLVSGYVETVKLMIVRED